MAKSTTINKKPASYTNKKSNMAKVINKKPASYTNKKSNMAKVINKKPASFANTKNKLVAKKPAACIKRSSSLKKKPAAHHRKTDNARSLWHAILHQTAMANQNLHMKNYGSMLVKCPVCDCLLKDKSYELNAKCVIVGSETLELATSSRKCCKACETTVRHNYMWNGPQKINVMSYDQMVASGVYFVTNNFAFTMKYLELQYFRLLRTQEAPGQEADVRAIVHDGQALMPKPRQFKDHLLHALEGYAVARRNPTSIIAFDVEFPSNELHDLGSNLLFPSTDGVKELCFDGHFGVHRPLMPSVEPERSVRLKGRQRKYKEHERTCSCARKDTVRATYPNRTAGWQFVVHPTSGRVLGAKEHIQNESCSDKADLLIDVMGMPGVSPDTLIHDDNCTFEAYVQKRHSSAFKKVKHFVIDKFHAANHKCSKRVWTKVQQRRLAGLPTSICEIFNSWIRRLNFFLNGLRPYSHVFWMVEAITFYNKHSRSDGLHQSRRTNAAMRSRSN